MMRKEGAELNESMHAYGLGASEFYIETTVWKIIIES